MLILFDDLEGDPGGCLQTTTASNPVHASLPAPQCTGNATEVAGREDVAASGVRVVELGSVAQLECIQTSLKSCLSPQREALEDGEIVLNVARAAELVASSVTELHVLSVTTR